PARAGRAAARAALAAPRRRPAPRAGARSGPARPLARLRARGGQPLPLLVRRVARQHLEAGGREPPAHDLGVERRPDPRVERAGLALPRPGLDLELED